MNPYVPYDLIENEDGTLAVKIHEGVTSLVEYPLMPPLFECNDRVTRVLIPDSLEDVYVNFKNYFPNIRRASGKKTNTHWGDFVFTGSHFHSSGHPVEVPPNLSENDDGTYTLDVAEGVCALRDMPYWGIYRKVSVLRLPASLQEITLDISDCFCTLREVCVHPDNPHFIVEDNVLFTADKKKILLYPRGKEGDVYRIGDEVEVIGVGCFAAQEHLKSLYIGKGVRKIEACGLSRDFCFCLRQIYIPPTVTELEGEVFDMGAADSGYYYPVDMVGGAKGSAIELYCNQRGIDFMEVAEDEVEDFYAADELELIRRAKEQAEQATEYWADESDKGYRLHFVDGT